MEGRKEGREGGSDFIVSKALILSLPSKLSCGSIVIPHEDRLGQKNLLGYEAGHLLRGQRTLETKEVTRRGLFSS
jgi:hypothetical protein